MTRAHMQKVATAGAVLLAVATGSPALAHDVSYELRGSGEARVAFQYQDGAPMASAPFAVFAPDAGVLPSVTGLTNSAGEVKLSAVRDGIWRVEVHDAAGHASRAKVSAVRGVLSLAGQRLPNWLVASSLLANLLLGGWLALGRTRARSVGRRAIRLVAQQGSVPT